MRGAIAIPPPSATMLVSCRVPNRLDGPASGAENRTTAEGTAFPEESTTWAARAVLNIEPTVVLSGVVPETGETRAAVPFTTVSVSERTPERDPLLARI